MTHVCRISVSCLGARALLTAWASNLSSATPLEPSGFRSLAHLSARSVLCASQAPAKPPGSSASRSSRSGSPPVSAAQPRRPRSARPLTTHYSKRAYSILCTTLNLTRHRAPEAPVRPSSNLRLILILCGLPPARTLQRGAADPGELRVRPGEQPEVRAEGHARGRARRRREGRRQAAGEVLLGYLRTPILRRNKNQLRNTMCALAAQCSVQLTFHGGVSPRGLRLITRFANPTSPAVPAATENLHLVRSDLAPRGTGMPQPSSPCSASIMSATSAQLRPMGPLMACRSWSSRRAAAPPALSLRTCRAAG